MLIQSQHINIESSEVWAEYVSCPTSLNIFWPKQKLH